MYLGNSVTHHPGCSCEPLLPDVPGRCNDLLDDLARGVLNVLGTYMQRANAVACKVRITRLIATSFRLVHVGIDFDRELDCWTPEVRNPTQNDRSTAKSEPRNLAAA